MRILLALLLWPVFALAGPLDGPLKYCSHIDKYVLDANVCGVGLDEGCCPADLTSPLSGANLMATAMDGSVVTSKDSGTMYGCARLAATSKRTAAQIIAGTGCVDLNSVTVSAAGVVNFSSANAFSGLTESTDYSVDYYHLVNGGIDFISTVVVSTASVMTLAAAGTGGADLTGTGFFVCPTGGSDTSNNGTSPSTPWQTLSKVNSAVSATGSDVYLCTNGVFEDQQLVNDWSGTPTDRVQISTYYLDAGDGNIPKQYGTGTLSGQGAKAEINGTFEAACRAPGVANCVLNEPPAVPSGIFAGLVRLHGDYVTLSNISIKDSAGFGIDGDGDDVGDGLLRSPHIEGVDVDAVAFGGMTLNDKVRNAEVRNNKFTRMAWCDKWEDQGETIIGGPYATCGINAQPGCVSITRSDDSYSLLENNLVSRGRCEGFNFSRGSYMWVRGNTITNTGVGVFGNHANDIIVEQNIILGNPDNGNRFARANQHGVGFALEPNWRFTEYAGGGDNLVRNNMIAGGDFCLHLNSLHPLSADEGLTQSLYGYGNVCVGQELRSFFQNNGSGANAAVGEFTLIGNIVYSPTASVAECTAITLGTGSMHHNMYASNPADSDCDGTGDVYGNPGLPMTEAQYRNLDWTVAESLTLDDFRLPAGASAAKNASILQSLPAWATALLSDPGWDNVTSQGGGFSACDGTMNLTLEKDANCDTRDAAPNMGALEGSL